MLTTILFYIWIAGILYCTFCYCKDFAGQIKLMKSSSSFIYLVLDVLLKTIMSLMWPVILSVTVLQAPFQRKAIEDFNQALAESVGYDLDEED